MGISYDNNSNNPIIAAIKNLDDLDYALESPCSKIFLLTGNIFNLKEISHRVEEKNKDLYIHIESIDGFSKDTWGLEYIVKNINTKGIITDKPSLVKQSRDMGIFTIQRILVADSHTLNHHPMFDLENGRMTIKGALENDIFYNVLCEIEKGLD